MVGLGPTEVIIVLGVVLLLFGSGRVSTVLGELGKGVRAFKEGLNSQGDKHEPGENS